MNKNRAHKNKEIVKMMMMMLVMMMVMMMIMMITMVMMIYQRRFLSQVCERNLLW